MSNVFTHKGQVLYLPAAHLATELRMVALTGALVLFHSCLTWIVVAGCWMNMMTWKRRHILNMSFDCVVIVTTQIVSYHRKTNTWHAHWCNLLMQQCLFCSRWRTLKIRSHCFYQIKDNVNWRLSHILQYNFISNFISHQSASLKC